MASHDSLDEDEYKSKAQIMHEKQNKEMGFYNKKLRQEIIECINKKMKESLNDVNTVEFCKDSDKNYIFRRLHIDSRYLSVSEDVVEYLIECSSDKKFRNEHLNGFRLKYWNKDSEYLAIVFYESDLDSGKGTKAYELFMSSQRKKETGYEEKVDYIPYLNEVKELLKKINDDSSEKIFAININAPDSIKQYLVTRSLVKSFRDEHLFGFGLEINGNMLMAFIPY